MASAETKTPASKEAKAQKATIEAAAGPQIMTMQAGSADAWSCFSKTRIAATDTSDPLVRIARLAELSPSQLDFWTSSLAKLDIQVTFAPVVTLTDKLVKLTASPYMHRGQVLWAI